MMQIKLHKNRNFIYLNCDKFSNMRLSLLIESKYNLFQ